MVDNARASERERKRERGGGIGEGGKEISREAKDAVSG